MKRLCSKLEAPIPFSNNLLVIGSEDVVNCSFDDTPLGQWCSIKGNKSNIGQRRNSLCGLHQTVQGKFQRCKESNRSCQSITWSSRQFLHTCNREAEEEGEEEHVKIQGFGLESMIVFHLPHLFVKCQQKRLNNSIKSLDL